MGDSDGSQHPPKRRLVRGGSIDYLCCNSELPVGPTTVEEAADWPCSLLKSLMSGPQGHLRKRRLEAVWQDGLVLHSDFSGRGSVEVGHNMVASAAISLGMHLPHSFVRSLPVVQRESDSVTSSIVLVHFGCVSSCHVHGCSVERCCSVARQHSCKCWYLQVVACLRQQH